MKKSRIITKEQKDFLSGKKFGNIYFFPILNSECQWTISNTEAESGEFEWLAGLPEENYTEIQLTDNGIVDISNNNLDSSGINERIRNVNEYSQDNAVSRVLLAGGNNEPPDSSSGGIDGLAEIDGLLNKGFSTITK